MPNDEATDLDLIAEWRKGNEAAAAELVRRHARAVARYLGAAGADHDDIDDLVQDTFFKAFRRVDSFRGGAAFRTWLMSIGSNVLKDAWRSRKRKPTTPIEDREFIDESRDPLGESEADEMQTRLEECVRVLPRLQRDVFLLRAQQGLDYEEIARALETTTGAARVHYHHAVKRLKKAMTGSLQRGEG